jgi:hypothetical protein
MLGVALGDGGVGALTLLPRVKRKAMAAIPIALRSAERITRLCLQVLLLTQLQDKYLQKSAIWSMYLQLVLMS